MRQTALTALLLGLAAPLAAQDAAVGAELYATHCAVCHGADATGGGPLAPSLIVQPVDLTQLAARNGGDFPTLRVVMRIDGQEPLVSHGSPMPVYGPFFEGVAQAGLSTASGQPILVSVPVADLVTYLQDLQE